MLPQSRREGPLGVMEATRRLSNPSPGGWQCALPAASWPHGWRYRTRLARGDGQQAQSPLAGLLVAPE